VSSERAELYCQAAETILSDTKAGYEAELNAAVDAELDRQEAEKNERRSKHNMAIQLAAHEAALNVQKKTAIEKMAEMEQR